MNKQIYTTVKTHLPLIVATALLFLFTFLLKQIQFKQLKPTFTQNYKELYKNTPTVEIAGFEEGEQWQGNFTLDTIRTFDAATGMNLSSFSGKDNAVTLNKPLNLNDYENIYANVFVADQNSLSSFKQLVLQFNSKDKKTTASITKLEAGWNIITIPKKQFDEIINWNNITSVTLTLTSMPKTTTQISLGRVWAQKDLKNTDVFLKKNNQFLHLKSIGKNTYLHTASPNPETVLFQKKVKNDFLYTVGIAPIRLGNFSLVFQTDKENNNGYSFTTKGQKMSLWSIERIEKGVPHILAQGTIKGNVFERDALVWLRIEKKGDVIKSSYSFNNQLFTAIGEVKDNSYIAGYVGFSSQGSFLIDSLEVKE